MARVRSARKNSFVRKRTFSPISRASMVLKAEEGGRKNTRALYNTYQYLYEQDSKDLDAAIYTLRRLKKD